jgi:sugar phosphate isomerase/epimerase
MPAPPRIGGQGACAVLKQPISIQSWCYRQFKAIPDFVEQLKATGVSSTELSGAHADFLDRSSHASTIEALNAGGVSLVAIGVEYLSGDKEQDRPRFEFCKAAGIRNMSISFQPDAMFDGVRNIEALADEYDLQLGIHNHGGYDWLGNPTILKYIFSKTGKRIGLHLDTAWAIDAKQDALAMAETFADRLVGIHIKDFVYDRARKPSDVVIGSGNLDLPRLARFLDQLNFNGPLVIEYEGDVENPVPALKQCVAALRSAMPRYN